MLNPMIPRPAVPEHPDDPEIPPVPDGADRPFWSVMIPTYNRPDLLPATLRSILAQAPGPEDMQIMVVDNASDKGDIAALVQEIGQGRLEYHRHPENIGLTRNWTSCIQLARGHYIHMMHDDDLVQSGFYAACREYIETYGVDVLFSQSILIDDAERWRTITDPITSENGIVPQPLSITHGVSSFTLNTLIAARRLYEQTGGYTNNFHFGCDHEICARLFRIGQVGYLAKPGTLTRQHTSQDSRANWSKPHMMPQYFLAFRHVLRGADDTPYNRRLVYTNFGKALIGIAEALIAGKHYGRALQIAGWAFRTAPSEITLAHMALILRLWCNDRLLLPLRWTLGKLKRAVLR